MSSGDDTSSLRNSIVGVWRRQWASRSGAMWEAAYEFRSDGGYAFHDGSVNTIRGFSGVTSGYQTSGGTRGNFSVVGSNKILLSPDGAIPRQKTVILKGGYLTIDDDQYQRRR